MKNSITCPNCKHRAQTRFGFQIKANIRYDWTGDYVWGLLNCLKPYASRYRSNQADLPWYKILMKKKGLLGFWCRHCGKPLPKKMTEEILDYLHKKDLLAKLTNHGNHY